MNGHAWKQMKRWLYKSKEDGETILVSFFVCFLLDTLPSKVGITERQCWYRNDQEDVRGSLLGIYNWIQY